MQSEIDTMSYVLENTDIPVPRVFAYDTTAKNPVGAPYIFMECFQGTCAMDMPGCNLSIPDEYVQKYTPSEAAILVHFVF